MPSLTHIRVRYKDTDTMSVVYYGNYLTYFEVGRVEYLREKSLPMSLVNQRIHMPVVEAFVKYVKPAKLDDLLEVVATGFTRDACWNPATAKMIALPDWLKEIMPDADLDPTDR